MNRNNPRPAHMGNKRLPDRNALWIISFIAIAVLGVILFFIVKLLVLKLLFLLIAIGAAVYCWLLIESRRIMPKPAQSVSPSGTLSEAPAAETENEMPEQTEAGDTTGESLQSAGQDVQLVFVSKKGDKYHLDSKCVGLQFADAFETMPEEEAVSLNRKPCSKCWPKEKTE